jgi:hypothetical protein
LEKVYFIKVKAIQFNNISTCFDHCERQSSYEIVYKLYAIWGAPIRFTDILVHICIEFGSIKMDWTAVNSV